MLQIDLLLLLLEVREPFSGHWLLTILCEVVEALPFAGFAGYLFELFFYLCFFERWLVISWPFRDRKVGVSEACWSLGGDVLGLHLDVLHDLCCWCLPSKICVSLVFGELDYGLEVLAGINLNALGLSRSILGELGSFWLHNQDFWFDGLDRNLGLDFDSFLDDWSSYSSCRLFGGHFRGVGELLSLWMTAHEVLGGLFGHCDRCCFPFSRLRLCWIRLLALVDV